MTELRALIFIIVDFKLYQYHNDHDNEYDHVYMVIVDSGNGKLLLINC